jgi:hypothetical protein
MNINSKMKSTLHLLGVPKRCSWAFKYNKHQRFFETLLKRKNKQNQNQNRDATKVPFLMCTVLKIKENKRRKNKSTKKG